MFFVGAFSGNFLYLILAISYLAGFSALAMKNSEDQTKVIKSSDESSAHILYDITFNEHSFIYCTVPTFHTEQSFSEELCFGFPVIHYCKVLFIPPLLSPKSCYSGSALFSRPPPYLLV
jgi:hypothetical protein